MDTFFRASEYISYLLRSQSDQLLHSPFLFDFYTHCLKGQRKKNDYHKSLQKNHTAVSSSNLGAKHDSKTETVSSLVKKAAIPPVFGNILSRTIRHYEMNNVLELGTQLGVSSSYILEGSPEHFTSIEGWTAFQETAIQNLSKHFPNSKPNYILADLDVEFAEILTQENKKWDLVYLDANHTYHATLEYLEALLPYIHDQTFLIFDDIYWSKGMKKAWLEISNQANFHIAIDLYRWGNVIAHRGKTKEYFTLRF